MSGWAAVLQGGAGTAAEGGAQGAAGSLLGLGIIVAVMAVLGRMAGRLRMSPIPLYLLAGIAFGGHSILSLQLTQGFIEVGAAIGALLLLFMLGLDYTSDELSASLRGGWRAGMVDLVLNAAPGALLALVLGWGAAAAMLLGGITFVSSSGITSKVLTELEWLGNRETPTVLTILVVEDLAMAAYLPIAGAILVGGAPASAAVAVASALGAAAVALLLALRYGGGLSRSLVTTSDEVLLLSVLGLVLAVAGLAERLRFPATVGAFLVGVALTGDVARQVRRLLGPLRDLFAATFFLFFGLQIDASSIPPVLGMALGLAIVCVVTKMATGWWAAARGGISMTGRLRAGTALIARGEFSIVLAGLGVSAGLTPQLGPLAATYVLLTAVIGPILTRAADPVGHALNARLVAQAGGGALAAMASVRRAASQPGDSDPPRQAPADSQ